jgi:hypothetical protein
MMKNDQRTGEILAQAKGDEPNLETGAGPLLYDGTQIALFEEPTQFRYLNSHLVAVDCHNH